MTDGANLALSFTKGNALLGWRVTFATSARQGRKNEGNANIPRRLRGVSGFAYSFYSQTGPTRFDRPASVVVLRSPALSSTLCVWGFIRLVYPVRLVPSGTPGARPL